MSDDEEQTECDCCRYDGVALKPCVLDSRWGRKTFNLCGLCAGSYTGTLNCYPGSDQGIEVMRTVCYVGNAILDALAARPPKEPK